MPTITIIGATGMLGRPVAHAFIAAGWTVRAVVRDLDKARPLLPDGVLLYKGDLKQPEDLASALRGTDALYLNLSIQPKDTPDGWLTERDGIAPVLKVAKRFRVARVGYLSSIIYRYNFSHDFNWWVFDEKAVAVKKVQDSGIDYVIFHPSNFMENFTLGNYRQGNQIMLAGESREPMHFIAAADYAQQVVRAFSTLPAGESRNYDIQGPEALTADQAAEIFVRNYRGKEAPLNIRRVPLATVRLLGWFNRKMNYGYHIVKALNEYPEPFAGEQANRELGAATTTLAEFARRAE